MNRLRAVHVAWWLALAIGSFAVLYQFLPYETFLGLALNTAFAASLAAVIRYSVDGLRALREGKGGANFMLTSMLSIFTTIFIQRTWTMGLDALDRPQWMVMSFMTIFIPWIMAAALSLAIVAPDIDGDRKDSGWRLAGSVIIFILGMVVGIGFYAVLPDTVKSYSVFHVWPERVNRPSCKPEQPVWGSSAKIYHTEESRYRGVVIAQWCFGSIEEAEKAGFRPPKELK